MDGTPKITADTNGIWIKNGDRKYGIAFSEISAVSLGKTYAGENDKGEEIFDEVLYIDFEFGEYIELYEYWQGYNSALSSLFERILLLQEKYDKAKLELNCTESVVTLWDNS